MRSSRGIVARNGGNGCDRNANSGYRTNAQAGSSGTGGGSACSRSGSGAGRGTCSRSGGSCLGHNLAGNHAKNSCNQESLFHLSFTFFYNSGRAQLIGIALIVTISYCVWAFSHFLLILFLK
jgi:hypothetical protein